MLLVELERFADVASYEADALCQTRAKGPPQAVRGGEVAKRPPEKIGSSMTIVFKLRVGATVAVDR
jgi:hypothetical protein